MALTNFGALTDLQKTVYSKHVSKQGRDQNFFLSNGFVSKNTADMTKPIQRITELTKTARGIQAVLPLVADLTGGGVVGDGVLENNLEALISDSQIIQIDQIRNGVRSAGRMAEQATVIRFRTQAMDALSFWLADVIDELKFLTIAGRAFTLNTDGSTRATSQLPNLTYAADVTAATSNRIIYGGSASSEATIVAGDTVDWDLVTKAKAFAKRKRLKPIMAGGKGYYILVLSTEQCRDLEQDSDYKTITSQAMPRGLKNPLFDNSKKIINEIVVYDHQKVFNTLGLTSGNRWGSSGTIHGAQAMLLGAQALGFAQLASEGAGYEESDNTDFKNRPAIAVGRICGLLKPVYKSRYDNNSAEDYGVIHIKTAAAA